MTGVGTADWQLCRRAAGREEKAGFASALPGEGYEWRACSQAVRALPGLRVGEAGGSGEPGALQVPRAG